MRIIGLGYDCHTPIVLKRLKLSRETNIFDWFSSHYLSDIISLIKIKFKDISSNDGRTITGTRIVSDHYPGKNLTSILQRRASRFLEHMNDSEEILFIRTSKTDSYDELLKLRDTLKDINPDKKFNILVITYNNTIKYDNIDPQIKCIDIEWDLIDIQKICSTWQRLISHEYYEIDYTSHCDDLIDVEN